VTAGWKTVLVIALIGGFFSVLALFAALVITLLLCLSMM